MRTLALLIFTLFVSPVLAHDWEAVPIRHYVEDQAQVLTQEQASKLTEKLKEISTSRADSPQMAIVIVKSLDDRSIEDFATDVFNKAGIGQKDKDNGVLILLAPTERKIRIEVGYGLESVITDGRARVVIDSMKSHLKKGHEDWYAALDTGVQKISDLLPKPGETVAPDSLSSAAFFAVIFILLIFFVVLVSLITLFIRVDKEHTNPRIKSKTSSDGFWIEAIFSTSSSSGSDSSFTGGGGSSGGGGASSDF
jgi:uncharacterized protein